MQFQQIERLFESVQSIKRKYPMIVSYYKYLQEIASNKIACDKEVNCFTTWLLDNPQITEKKLSNAYYKGSKPNVTIYFGNVLELGTDETIATFWNRLSEIERSTFPTGRPSIVEPSPGTTAALALLESNPIFANVLESVKSSAANFDFNDIESIVGSKEVLNIVQQVQSNIKSGSYSVPDLMATLGAVIGTIHDELDPEWQNVASSAVSMVKAAERGETPDVNELYALIQNINKPNL
jgi:hypothetical protein